MTDLIDAVRDELRAREQRREALVAELAGVDRDLEQLTQMSELATSLNGNGATTAPELSEPSRERAERAGAPAPVSGNGGNAPTLSTGSVGSAPSGAPKRAPLSTRGSKRAAVLAYIQEHGEVAGASTIAYALGISVGAMYQHLKGLIESGEIQAKGPKSARVYFCPATSGSADTPPQQEEPMDTTVVQAAAVTQVLEQIDSAMHAKEIAYQATKNGTPVSEREASTILLGLEQDGKAVRFNGVAGRLIWRAAE